MTPWEWQEHYSQLDPKQNQDRAHTGHLVGFKVENQGQIH